MFYLPAPTNMFHSFYYLGRTPWNSLCYGTLGHLWRLRESWRQLLTWKINYFIEEFISAHRYSLNVSWTPTAVCLKTRSKGTSYFCTLKWLSNGSDQKRWAEASWNWLGRQDTLELEILGQPVTSFSSLPFPSIPFYSTSTHSIS